MTERFDNMFGVWLEDGPTVAPDHTVEAIRSSVVGTRQRRRSVFRLRSETTMLTGPRLGLAAAAAVAALAIGLGLLPTGTNPSAGGPASPSPSPFMTSSPTRLPSPSAAGPRQFQGVDFTVPFALYAPTTWRITVSEATMFNILRPVPGRPDWPAAGVDVTVVGPVSSDPCNLEAPLADPPIGPTARDLANWMAGLELLHASAPVQASLAGQTAIQLDESFVGEPACPELQLWRTGAGYVASDERKRYYVLDVGAVRVVVVAIARDEGTAADFAEAEAVVATLTFE